MEFENTERPKVGQIISIDFKWANIHTSWYASCSREEAKDS